ncbi:restriction endonuclease subunit S [Helicobacter pylori]|uniref:Type I restriction modification DNA specificity domain protein n=1 Tax=Helicobacter pylori GAM260BSi TaxID=1159046 RepID=M3QQR5_HELPX|nr:restriction endonuclease subunit S [Helicobacter pylori]EMH21707.1 type I restriction modification DNA specificity domain protein [Helicobacter pylori GAM260BSi]EMH67738.1 type I restriction modification DNA specificity domain protein [Helicobacter pylori HP260BFii]
MSDNKTCNTKKNQIVKLGDILEVLTDYHSNGSYKTLKENVTLLEQPNFAIMIRTTNFEKNDFRKNLIYINQQAYNFLSKSKVLHQDILINKIANAGAVYFMPRLDKPVSLGMNLFLLRIKKNYNKYFIFCILKYNEKRLRLMAKGTTTKTITKDNIKMFQILLPPLETQQKIARTLSVLDQRIENNHKINELLHTLAHKVYEYYFKYKPKNAKLEQIIIENPKSSIMVKNAQKTQDKYPFFTSGDNTLSYPKAIIDGRNCFLNTGGNAGIKFYVGKASYSTDTWCISANEFSDYLYLLLSSIKTHINQSFFQGTSLKHLQKNLLKKYPIYMPSAHEIKKFNQIIMPLLTLISINTRISKKLEQIRDFLLPLLLKQQVKPQ